MKDLIWPAILFLCACAHNEPEVPDRSNAIDRNKPDSTATSAPADTIPVTNEYPTGAVVPDVLRFGCSPYTPGVYKIDFWIENPNECGMLGAAIFYGADPNNLQPAKTEYYPQNKHIMATVYDLAPKTKYYICCHIIMADWFYQTELKSYTTL